MEHFQEKLTTLFKNAEQTKSISIPEQTNDDKEPYDVGGAALKKLWALMPPNKRKQV